MGVTNGVKLASANHRPFHQPYRIFAVPFSQLLVVRRQLQYSTTPTILRLLPSFKLLLALAKT